MAKYKEGRRTQGKGIMEKLEGVEYKGAQRAQLHLTHTYNYTLHTHTQFSYNPTKYNNFVPHLFFNLSTFYTPRPTTTHSHVYIFFFLYLTDPSYDPPLLLHQLCKCNAPLRVPTQTHRHTHLHRIREIVCIDVYLSKVKKIH